MPANDATPDPEDIKHNGLKNTNVKIFFGMAVSIATRVNQQDAEARPEGRKKENLWRIKRGSMGIISADLFAIFFFQI